MTSALHSAPAVEALLEAARSMEAHRLREVLREVTDRHGVEDTVTDVVLPFLNAVGVAWECGDLSVAQEHFASQVVRSYLMSDGLAGEVHTARAPSPIVLACPPGERHDMGLLCFHVLLTRAGVPTRFLGSDTPLTGLADVCRLLDASGVVIAATRTRAFEVRERALQVLSRRYPTAIGGAGADPALADRIGATLLPSDMARAAHDLSDWHAQATSAA